MHIDIDNYVLLFNLQIIAPCLFPHPPSPVFMSMVLKRRPFSTDFNFGNKKKSTEIRSGK